ncbi:hypothetical protein [Rothia dentocariosa]|uniref:hypothetical protein n=1 Tax=Rothia dentocariosa TaxID=2047 RepID=UPI0024203AEE|nr:hypothetical protein [Rothia dentocariosa]
MDAWEAGWWGLTHPTEGIKVCDPSGTNCSDTMSAAEAATNPGKAAGQIAGNWADEQVMKFVESFYSGALNMFQSFITDFLHIGPVIDVAHDETMSYMKIAMGPFVWFAVVIGILIPCMKYFWTQRGQHLKDIWPGLLRVSAISAGGGTMVAIAIVASDAAAKWFIDIVGWKPEDVVGLFKVGAASGGTLFAGMMIIGIIMILVLLVQYAIMMIKAIMVPILVIFWPASEAMNMAAGELRMSRTARWLLALIIYKPVLAVLFAFAFKLLIDGVNEQDPIKVVGKLMQSMGVLLLSVFTLPAIMKIIMPQASAATSSGGGTELMQAVKTAAMVAAMAVTGGAAGAGAAGAGEAGAAGGGSGGAAGLAGGTGGGGGVGPTLGESGQMPGGTGSGSSGSSSSAATSSGGSSPAGYVSGSGSDSGLATAGEQTLGNNTEADAGPDAAAGQDDGVDEISTPQPLGDLGGSATSADGAGSSFSGADDGSSSGGSSPAGYVSGNGSDSGLATAGEQTLGNNTGGFGSEPAGSSGNGSIGGGTGSSPSYGAGSSSSLPGSQPSFEGQRSEGQGTASRPGSAGGNFAGFADSALRYSQVFNSLPSFDVESHVVDESHLDRRSY